MPTASYSGEATVIGSISVGSSSAARELFTRFDTGHRCKLSLSVACGLAAAI
jgi:hypothetical protein